MISAGLTARLRSLAKEELKKSPTPHRGKCTSTLNETPTRSKIADRPHQGMEPDTKSGRVLRARPAESSPLLRTANPRAVRKPML
jgi:hypothetical protein